MNTIDHYYFILPFCATQDVNLDFPIGKFPSDRFKYISGYLEKVKSLYTGNQLSNCPMPCNTFATNTRLMSKRATADKSHIVLSFSETVQMTITEMEAPSISGLLSAIGGSIGLWLGIGVFQAVQILYSHILAPLANRIRKT